MELPQKEWERTKDRLRDDQLPPLPDHKNFGRSDTSTPKDWAATALPSPPPSVVSESIKKEIDEAAATLPYSKEAQNWAKKATEDGFISFGGYASPIRGLK